MNTPHHLMVVSLFLLGSWSAEVLGQVECTGQGNLRGIRVDGELLAFSTTIRAVVPTGADESQGSRGRGAGGQFSRAGGVLTVNGRLTGGFGRRGGPDSGGPRGGPPPAGVRYRATFKDAAPGTVDAEVEITSTTNIPTAGVFFAIAVRGADYNGGSAQLIAPTSATEPPVSLAATGSPGTNLYLRASAKGVRLVASRRQIELNLPAPAEWVIRDVRARTNSDIEVSFPLSLGNLTNGQNVHAAFTIKAAGEIDKSPARLVLDPSRPGRQPLQPAQRFWQLKQLGMTAQDSTAMPIACDNPKVVSCASADHGTCVVHLVNNGAARTVTVSGIPAGVKEMRVFVTDSRRGMEETGRVPVVQGTVQLPVDAMSFTSLAGNGEIK